MDCELVVVRGKCAAFLGLLKLTNIEHDTGKSRSISIVQMVSLHAASLRSLRCGNVTLGVDDCTMAVLPPPSRMASLSANISRADESERRESHSWTGTRSSFLTLETLSSVKFCRMGRERLKVHPCKSSFRRHGAWPLKSVSGSK